MQASRRFAKVIHTCMVLGSLIINVRALLVRSSLHGLVWSKRPRTWRALGSSLQLDDENQTTTTRAATRYTISTPPIDAELLQTTVYKNFANFERYWQRRPVAGHTQEAFAQFLAELDRVPRQETNQGFILDSGCGTGRSSLLLGKLFPQKIIVGVDRSIDRLGRTARELPFGNSRTKDESQELTENEENDDDGYQDKSEHDDDDDKQHVQRVEDNVILVRAELIHFWRLWWEHGFVAEQHFLLYPNPYPKKSRLKQRWYAHPSFPLLLAISAGRPLTVRSNWEQYLREFADAVVYTSQYTECEELPKAGHSTSGIPACASRNATMYNIKACQGPRLRPAGDAWTNFEAKYDKIGEPTFELILQEEDGGS